MYIEWHLEDDIDKNAPNVDIATDLFGLLAPSGIHVNRRRLQQEKYIKFSLKSAAHITELQKRV